MNTQSSPFPSVFITQTSSGSTTNGQREDSLAERMRETYLRGANRPFPLADNARDADIVVFWEPYQASEVTLAPKLRQEALALGNPDKVFVVSGEDRPAGFLPGVYTGTPLIGWDRHRFRSGPYCYVMNPLIAEAARKRDQPPRLLYSFVGANTAEVRKSIFEKLKTQDHCVIRETGNMQFTIDVDDPAKRPGQGDYLQTMLESAFVLCPRGCGHSSYRLFETMQLGRVPVILSDDWVAPQGPAWNDFSIRIAERQVDRIDEILRQFSPQSAEMGRRARAEWESWFRPEVIPWRVLQWIYDIYLSRPHSEAEYVKKWRRLAWSSQWPPPLPLRVKRKLSRMLHQPSRWAAAPRPGD